VVLNLIILVIIVSNVILWSYQMNQLDWDKTQENVTISSVSRLKHATWFTTQSEFQTNIGNSTSGSYIDTQAVNGSYESFTESSSPCTLDINGTFSIDFSDNPLACIQSVEILLKYAVSDTGEKWYIEAWDWTTRTYSSAGFNSTSGSMPSAGWNTYSVNLTDQWQKYLSGEGRIDIRIHDEGPDSTRTTIDLDFVAVRVVASGTVFVFQNNGSRTVHLVSLWISNSTQHRRFDLDEFINSGETLTYSRFDVSLPDGVFMTKVITERGNTAVYTDA
jgi:hypothetical protein